MTHLQEWYEARKQCLEAPINDPDYRIKLNRLSEAEDALYKQARDDIKQMDYQNKHFDYHNRVADEIRQSFAKEDGQ
jgi:hypothetical protein